MMTPDQLLQAFTRIVRTDDGVEIQWRDLVLGKEGVPTSMWRVAARLEQNANPDKVSQARLALLSDPQYFVPCEKCGKVTPLGWLSPHGDCPVCAAEQSSA